MLSKSCANNKYYTCNNNFTHIFTTFVLKYSTVLDLSRDLLSEHDPDSELLNTERREQAVLHLNLSRSGALPGATWQKYILGLKGAEGHAATLTGAVFKNK